METRLLRLVSRFPDGIGQALTEGVADFFRGGAGLAAKLYNGLFTFALGADLGNDKQSAADGIIEGGIIATQLTGPLLVKNPAVLEYVYQRLTGEALQIADNNPLNLAYDNALRQLSARLG